MRGVGVLVAGLMALAAAGCERADRTWFEADPEAAAAAAEARGTLVMLDFSADWCSWCKRLDEDTFSDQQVRQQLGELVVVKLDAEREGRELAKRYGVESYPTLVFTDPDGEEIDRIVGFLPPGDFISETERIRSGDTFLACLARLDENPADAQAIERAVSGLLDRSDPEGAIARTAAFHEADREHDHDLCELLEFRARTALHSRLYGRAAILYRSGWSAPLEVPDEVGTRRLFALAAGGLARLPEERQAVELRAARHADGGALLDLVSPDRVPADRLQEYGEFAFDSGHYDLAGVAYQSWFETAAGEADADLLNRVAWQLYQCRRSLDTAVAAADRAWAMEPSADVADTLAHLRYVTGAVPEAIALERRAVALAEEDAAAALREAVELMEAGGSLEDRPPFEGYPGGAEPARQPSSTVMM
jgi:thioredoxin-related protein/tetratricopeptide (TPR) repeat protein